MCGIAGYVGRGNEKNLANMVASLHHRGPDDHGTLVKGTVGLGQSRLSIIDLSPAGHQPMSNEDGSVWIVFNGEIYDFAGLRESLTKKHTFKGYSDTEVIVHLYEEIGTEVFSKIHGMFAVAILDAKKDRLILARDRMGKKPLFWSVQNDTLMFGSELKALMQHPSFTKDIDPASLNKYFLYEYVPTPATIFKNTWKLEPGTFLVWDGKEAKKTQFWKPTFLPKAVLFDDSLDSLDAALSKAVSDRLVSDVPLGIFLSGGIDSSAIAYYAQQAHQRKVKTFSIGFTEASFDESSYARTVAQHLGTEHFEKILSAKDSLDLIPRIGEMLDEPMADASIVPTYLLSQFTREHVTVALGGDGGDELFCGYDTFVAHKLATVYGILPVVARRFVQSLAGHIPTSYSNMSFDFKLKKFMQDFDDNPLYRNQKWLGAFGEEDRRKLFAPDVWTIVQDKREFEDVDRYAAECDSQKLYDQLGYVYERMYMMDQVLVKVDRASMMHALEVRAPFLDTRVVDLANHMPLSFKFKGFERKYILKRLMKDKLPHDIIYRKKKGFGMPIGQWLCGDLKPFVTDMLSADFLRSTELFNPVYVERLMSDHIDGIKDNRKQLWTLLIFAMWWRKWMT